MNKPTPQPQAQQQEGTDHSAPASVGGIPENKATVTATMEQITYGCLNAEVAKANVRLIAAAPDMLTLLRDDLTYFEEREDVRDGSDGRQLPNQAMHRAQEIRALLLKLGEL